VKYQIGPYRNDEIAVSGHLPQDGRCFAIALTAICVVPLPGKPGTTLSREDTLEALEILKKRSETVLTDRILQVNRGSFEVSAIVDKKGEETVVAVYLALPEFRTGDKIQ
jgi:hypothetical protein